MLKLIGANATPVDGTLGLDVFTGHAVTVVPGTAIVIETPKSLVARTATARERHGWCGTRKAYRSR